MGAVTFRGVSKSFGGVEILRGIDLEIADGVLVVVVGPSGCGKSTLLRLVAGLEEVTAGDIEIAGRTVTHLPPAARRIAMVFQSYALYPHMNVFDNMAFGLKLARTDTAAIEARVMAAARLLQIDRLLRRKPRELSGGQRQRVAMGRALVREPEVFLFDEPLSNLDAALRVGMRLEIARLQRELGTTMIYVTHDQTEAMTLAQTIVVMRDGRIEQTGPPLELYRRPRNLFVAGFIGSPAMNILPARAGAPTSGRMTVDLEGGGTVSLLAVHGARQGDRLSLGLRPEDLSLVGDAEPSDGQTALRGTVAHVERLGAESHVYVDTTPGEGSRRRLTVFTGGAAAVHPGDLVTIGFTSAHCLVFDAEGEAVALEAPS